MFCLKLSEANIGKSDEKGQVRYRKYDLPDHLPVGLNFLFYQ
jgi:nitrate reductase assembly molybdenum cofactor insertion protein NarJ